MLIYAGDNSSMNTVDNLLFSYQHQIKLPSQPKGIHSVSGGLAIVACINEVLTSRTTDLSSI